MSKQISFRSAQVEPELTKRSKHSLGLTAARDLERYYQLLQYALPALTTEEANFLCDLLNGTINDFRFNPRTVLEVEVRDGFELTGLDQKWGVNKQFLDKIRSWSVFEAAAVIDAVERYWIGEAVKDIFNVKAPFQ